MESKYFATRYTIATKTLDKLSENDFIRDVNREGTGENLGALEPVREVGLKVIWNGEVHKECGLELENKVIIVMDNCIFHHEQSQWPEQVYVFDKEWTEGLGIAVNLYCPCDEEAEDHYSVISYIDARQDIPDLASMPQGVSESMMEEAAPEEFINEPLWAENESLLLAQPSLSDSIGPEQHNKTWFRFYKNIKTFTFDGKTYMFGHSEENKRWFVSIDDNYFETEVASGNWRSFYDIIELFKIDQDVFMFGYSNKANRFFVSKFDTKNLNFEVESSQGSLSFGITLAKIFQHKGKTYLFVQYEGDHSWRVLGFDSQSCRFDNVISSGKWHYNYEQIDIFSIDDNTYMYGHSNEYHWSFLSIFKEYKGSLNFECELNAYSYDCYNVQKIFAVKNEIYLLGHSKDFSYAIYKYNRDSHDFKEKVCSYKLDSYYPTLEVYNKNGITLVSAQNNDRKYMVRTIILNTCYNTQSWMGDLAHIIGDTDIRILKIPATHNSGAFINYAFTFGRVADQKYNIYDQLMFGVRCFDIRLMQSGNTIYMHHNGIWYKEQTLNAALEQISKFLSKSQKEFIVLKLAIGNTSDPTPAALDNINSLFEKNIGKFIFKYNGENQNIWLKPNCTLNRMVRSADGSSNQVLLSICAGGLNGLKERNKEYYWPNNISGTWTKDVYNRCAYFDRQANALKTHLTKCIEDRSDPLKSKSIFFADSYLYNSMTYIEYMAIKAQEVFQDIIAELTPKRHKNINFVLYDYYNANVGKQIIDLNLYNAFTEKL